MALFAEVFAVEVEPDGGPCAAAIGSGHLWVVPQVGPVEASSAVSPRLATARASATCRTSTLAPGSSTRLRCSHATAWLNNATGPSGWRPRPPIQFSKVQAAAS